MSACNEIIDDIEDLISAQEITPKERYANKKNVTVRARKVNAVEEEETAPAKIIHESIIPGTQKIYLKTWGCSHNSSGRLLSQTFRPKLVLKRFVNH